MKRNKRLFFITEVIALLLIVLTGSFGFTAPTSPAQKPAYKLIFAEAAPRGVNPWLAPLLLDKIVKASGGRLQIQDMRGGEHPYALPEMLVVCSKGSLDMAIIHGLSQSGTEPWLGLMDLPFLLSGGAQELWALLNDPGFKDVRDAAWDNPLNKWNQLGLLTFGYTEYGFGGVLVNDLKDLKGKKMRASSHWIVEMLKVVGASGHNVPMNEMFTALKSGVIDGACTGLVTYQSGGLMEAAPYYTIAPYEPGLIGLTINKNSLAKLPKDLQGIILKTCALQEPVVREHFQTGYLSKGLMDSILKNYGTVRAMHPSVVANFRKLCEPLWDQWAQQVGPPAGEVLKRVKEFDRKWSESKK
jgi:TRAP-type C4-dicarboxylate transport system substrate-binding protein